MDSLRRLHDGRISSLEKELKEFKKGNDFLVDKVAAQAKQISALYVKPPQLSWRINEIEKILSLAREKRSTVLESSPFYSANHGFKLKMYVYPNGDVTNKHNYLSVFLVIMEGEYDSLLCTGQIEASTCPPRATPRAFDFFENYCSNSPLPGPKCRSNTTHWGPFR